MSSIGSHPGAILFRLSITIILITIIVTMFFSYLDDTEKALERSAILQTKRIIDSSLALVFATYAVKGRLDDLDQLDGGNPFAFLREYQLLPPAYQGELTRDVSPGLAAGWYYLPHRGQVVYRARYLETDSYFAIVLFYEDRNRSGFFESGKDVFNHLKFVEIERD